MSRFRRIVALIDLGFAVSFLIFAAVGLLLHWAGFVPSGVVFGSFGVFLVIVYLYERSHGYRWRWEIETKNH